MGSQCPYSLWKALASRLNSLSLLLPCLRPPLPGCSARTLARAPYLVGTWGPQPLTSCVGSGFLVTGRFAAGLQPGKTCSSTSLHKCSLEKLPVAKAFLPKISYYEVSLLLPISEFH
ncbi:hypothetical protein KIL84_003682 [Mauremys mutica]|uniref:Uncharacterized protein n=1 Tax=Mauremys mutica TaxID=74926 RepID=A0A9D3WU81_9SAUR|nr:hypothetical protein KIL84_003682 [Mauremys mutica]